MARGKGILMVVCLFLALAMVLAVMSTVVRNSEKAPDDSTSDNVTDTNTSTNTGNSGSSGNSGGVPTVTKHTSNFDGDGMGILIQTEPIDNFQGYLGFMFVSVVPEAKYTLFWEIHEGIESLGVSVPQQSNGGYNVSWYLNYNPAGSEKSYTSPSVTSKSEIYNNSRGLSYTSLASSGVVFVKLFKYELTNGMSDAELCEEAKKYVKYFTVTTEDASKIVNNPTYNVSSDSNDDEPVECTHAQKSYTSISAELHEVKCTDCGIVLSQSAHVFDNNVCTYCGYENSNDDGNDDGNDDDEQMCTHESYTYKISSHTVHIKVCADCAVELAQEAHEFENYICAKCGYDTTPEPDPVYECYIVSIGNNSSQSLHIEYNNERGYLCTYNITAGLGGNFNINKESSTLTISADDLTLISFISNCSPDPTVNSGAYEFVINADGGIVVSDKELVCEHTSLVYETVDNLTHSIKCSTCNADLGTEGHNFVSGSCTRCDCTEVNSVLVNFVNNSTDNIQIKYSGIDGTERTHVVSEDSEVSLSVPLNTTVTWAIVINTGDLNATIFSSTYEYKDNEIYVTGVNGTVTFDDVSPWREVMNMSSSDLSGTFIHNQSLGMTGFGRFTTALSANKQYKIVWNISPSILEDGFYFYDSSIYYNTNYDGTLGLQIKASESSLLDNSFDFTVPQDGATFAIFFLFTDLVDNETAGQYSLMVRDSLSLTIYEHV